MSAEIIPFPIIPALRYDSGPEQPVEEAAARLQAAALAFHRAVATEAVRRRDSDLIALAEDAVLFADLARDRAGALVAL